ncbi:hypothetical protein LH128_03379 [Sphingomonas sp. LH128]|nr:hypothetical protein LH128_03379 [Sphingomonas sp. LH128]
MGFSRLMDGSRALGGTAALVMSALLGSRGRHIKRAQIYALMTAIRDTDQVYPFAGRKTSVHIDLGGCAADA